MQTVDCRRHLPTAGFGVLLTLRASWRSIPQREQRANSDTPRSSDAAAHPLADVAGCDHLGRRCRRKPLSDGPTALGSRKGTSKGTADSADTKKPRFERESRLRDECWYRIPESPRWSGGLRLSTSPPVESGRFQCVPAGYRVRIRVQTGGDRVAAVSQARTRVTTFSIMSACSAFRIACRRRGEAGR